MSGETESLNPADFLSAEPTVDEAIALAREWHHEGKMQLASGIYDQVLQQYPDHVESLNFGGAMDFQMGNRDRGLERLRRCLELAPDYHDAHANLGLILYTTGDLGGAEAHMSRAIELDPQAINPRVNFAMLRRRQGRTGESIDLLRALVDEAPQHPLVRHALFTCLKATGNDQEAREHLLAAYGNNSMANAASLMAHMFALDGKIDAARGQIETLLEIDPESADLQHLLAAFGGAPVPARASDAAVREVFDNFAPLFDEKLAHLQYRAPELVAAALARKLGAAPGRIELLDAGCGTGLLGRLVRPLATRLCGVDLSAGMLRKAEDTKVYDELVQGELTAYLREHPAAFDVVTCVDTLCYFGALDTVCQAAHACLRPGGWLLFSVEQGTDHPEGHMLRHTGRYTHRQDYVEQTLAAAGFGNIEIDHGTLRSEARQPVAGLICAAQRGR